MSSKTVPLRASVSDTKETKEVDHDLDALRSDFESLKENVASLMSSVGRLAGKQGEKGVEKSKALAGDAANSLDHARESIEGQIRRKPLTSVGIAVGVGAMIAVLSRR